MESLKVTLSMLVDRKRAEMLIFLRDRLVPDEQVERLHQFMSGAIGSPMSFLHTLLFAILSKESGVDL